MDVPEKNSEDSHEIFKNISNYMKYDLRHDSIDIIAHVPTRL